MTTNANIIEEIAVKNLSDESITERIKSIDTEISMHEKTLINLKNSKCIFNDELVQRKLRNRIEIINEYREKLKNILNKEEYCRIAACMERTPALKGMILYNDIVRVYNKINEFKNKFPNIHLESFKFHGRNVKKETNYFSYRFSIDGVSDIFVGCNNNDIVNSSRKEFEDVLARVKDRDQFSFLNENEQFALTRFVCSKTIPSNFNMDILINKMKEAKAAFPEAEISDINFIYGHRIIIYIM